MISEERFYGGASYQEISSDFNILINKRVWGIKATSAGLKVKLSQYIVKGFVQYIKNVGTNSFDVYDGTTNLGTLAAGESAIVLYSGHWRYVAR